jgi:hypothetical protein
MHDICPFVAAPVPPGPAKRILNDIDSFSDTFDGMQAAIVPAHGNNVNGASKSRSGFNLSFRERFSG